MWETLLALARNKNHREHPLFIHAVGHFCNMCEQEEDREPSLELLCRYVHKPYLHCEEDIMEYFVRQDNVFLLRWWNETFGLKSTLGIYLWSACYDDATACVQYCLANISCWCNNLLSAYHLADTDFVDIHVLERVLQRMVDLSTTAPVDLFKYSDEDILALLDKYHVTPSTLQPNIVLQAMEHHEHNYVEDMLSRGCTYILDEALAHAIEISMETMFVETDGKLNISKVEKELERLPYLNKLVVETACKFSCCTSTVNKRRKKKRTHWCLRAIGQHKTAEAFMDTSFAKRLPQDLVKYVLKFL